GTVPYALYAGTATGIDTKLNIGDTTKMLSPYAKVSAFNNLSTTVNNLSSTISATLDSNAILNLNASKINIKDSLTTYVTPFQFASKSFDTSSIYTQLSSKELSVNKSTDMIIDANSDSKYPSVKSVKSYVDALVASNTIADASITDTKIVSISGSKIIGNIAGNAAAATKLSTARSINGVPFDGTSDITISSIINASALSGTVLASNVVGSSLTSVGTITSGTWSGTVIDIAHGGTGMTNAGLNGQILTSTSTGTLTWTTPSTSGVPYTGATGPVNLGSYDLVVNGLTVGLGRNAQSSNTVIGVSALSSNTNGIKNTGVGYQALNYNSLGSHNTGIGYQALHDNANASYNTAVGDSALYKNYSGNSNTALGYTALGGNFSASNNTGIGTGSLYSSRGSDNTAVGYRSLYTNTTGSQNTALGVGADVSSAALSNTTAIGYGAIVSTSNTIQLGNTSVTQVRTSGSITAGTITYPNSDGTNGQVLKTNGSGTLSWGDASGGVTSIGNIEASSNSKGAIVSSGVLSLAPADANNGGIVTTGVQTFSGNKTFKGEVSATAAVNNTEITSSMTISISNAAQYNGTVLICNPSNAINITIDNSSMLPTGFNFMVVQKSASANRVNFVAGSSANVVNRGGNTATAGQYAIATLVHIGNGVFVTSGDMQ
ncbi:MAG: hypothetical protein RL621_1668, partial [Bacteroidota bacterium]